jgi:hypothetical protein
MVDSRLKKDLWKQKKNAKSKKFGKKKWLITLLIN